MGLRLCSLLLAGTLLLFGQTPERKDAVMRDQVSMALTLDYEVRGGGLQVVVVDGAVTLRGLVKDEKARLKATKLAKKIKGVKTVDNQLRLPDEKAK
jgi:osmotically-inducible protein OsmY